MPLNQARIVSEIYDAAVEPGLWPAALDSIATAFGAVGAGYMLIDKATNSVPVIKLTGPAIDRQGEYVDYYSRIDLYRTLLNDQPIGEWCRLTERIPSQVLDGDEWYNDMLLRSGIDDLIGARLIDDGRHVAMFAVQHGLSQTTPTVYEAPHLRPLLDAIAKAAKLHRSLAQVGWRSAVALQALDRVATAVVIADETGRVVECNAAAERILRIDDGLSVRGGLLSPRRAFEALKLMRMIATAAATTN